MANRAYLYACDVIPGLNPEVTPTFTGISEFNYEVPLVYKLLMAGNPELCKSSIWDEPTPIAIAADLNLGLEKLEQFFSQITAAEAQPIIEGARTFFDYQFRKFKYFVLECNELYQMDDNDPLIMNKHMLKEIQYVATVTDFSELNEHLKEQFNQIVEAFDKENGITDPTLCTEEQNQALGYLLQNPLYELGLGLWSDILYFNLKN